MRTGGLLLVIAACGGSKVTPTSPEAPPPRCTANWLTLDRDVVDLDVNQHRVVWLEREHGRVAYMQRGGIAMKELRPASAGFEYTHDLALSGDRIVWVDAAGIVFTVDERGERTELSRVPRPMVIEATPNLIVVAGEEGVFGLTLNGDTQTLYPRYAWVMAIDETAAYVQANTVSGSPNSALLKLPFDGSEPTMLAPEERPVISILPHKGRVLFTTSRGVWEAVGGAVKPVVELGPHMDYIANLRAAGDRIYFTQDNLIMELRGNQAVPVAIASETIGDLEVDGTTFYVTTREYKGVRTMCIPPDAPAVAMVTPVAPTCLPGEALETTQYGAFECLLPESRDRTYTIGFHANGTKTEEYSRDNMQRTWYADGTLRSERPIKGAGIEKRFYVNGQLHEEGALDAESEYDGTWTEYAPDGTLRAKVEWVHGKKK